MTKILITGANGFVGGHLVEKFIKEGYKVKCLVHRNLDFINNISKINIEIYHGSITEPETLKDTVKDVDYIFHTSAVLRAIDTATYYNVNQIGTKNLIETAYRENKGLKKFVYISSQAASGPCENGVCKNADSENNPVSDYGKSKLMGEQEVLKFKDKMPVVILRPSAIYGPRDEDLFPFFRFGSAGIFPIISGDGNCRMQLLFIKDLVEICHIITSKEDIKGNLYFISEEKQYTWYDICDLIQKVSQKKVRKIVLPKSIVASAAYISEKLCKLRNKPAVFNRQKVTELRQKYWVFDISRTIKDFGYKFTNFEIGSKITYNWYKENNWL